MKKKSKRLDPLTPKQRSYTMRQVKSKNTRPELKLRSLVHGMGYRYRLHRKDLPGKPDLVFPKYKKVIFLHGCFWHGHGCKRGRNTPATNREYWDEKIGRNVRRDAKNKRRLRKLGWGVMVVWECRLKNRARLERRIRRFLQQSEAKNK